MVPVLWLGPGKSFGELAVQKDASAKLERRGKARQATVLCRTDCKFAVMSKADYQSVLDNIDRRRVEALKDFFKQIPLLRGLPRSVLNTLHLSLRPVKFQRGQVVCREGEASERLFIVAKGEFEVSKRIDTSKSEKVPKENKKVLREALPRRKLEE